MDEPPSNRYRKAIRLPDFDYSGNATYFVTICSAKRAMLFGEIREGRMTLSPSGLIAQEELRATLEIRPELEMHHFVVMPNHVHALLTITPTTAIPRTPPVKELQRPPRSLGSFISGYKSSVTSQIRKMWGMPQARVWQPNYYEHVVRSARAFEHIWDYIEHNPQRWSDDGENPGSPRFRS